MSIDSLQKGIHLSYNLTIYARLRRFFILHSKVPLDFSSMTLFVLLRVNEHLSSILNSRHPSSFFEGSFNNYIVFVKILFISFACF